MSTWTLAFIIAPILVVAIGYAAVRLEERRDHRLHPGE
jgi:hypothetical protein